MTRAGLRLEPCGGDALERLRRPWSELCDRCRLTTPFQRPEWLLPWVAHFGPREPWIGAAWDGGRLVALAPLFVYGTGERSVALLGAGISDYLDVVCEPAVERAAGDAALALVAERAGEWDRCHLDDLRRESPLCRAAAPPGLESRLERDGAWAVLALGGREGEDFAWLRPSRRKKISAALRRARRAGQLRFARAGGHDWRERWPELERLHAARWQARGESGVLTPSLQRFHREVAAGFCARGALSLYTLSLDAEVIAALYALEEQSTIYYYLSGFDPALAALSPGNLVVALAAEDARRRGLRRFDFLRGLESYKASWGAAEVPRFRRVLQSPRGHRDPEPPRARNVGCSDP